MNTRSRVCGAPKAQADRVPHSASYPRRERSPTTRPIPETSSPETFSTMTNLGRSSPTNRDISRHKPDCGPSIPALAPDSLTSWQGNPPTMTSTHGNQSRRPHSTQRESSLLTRTMPAQHSLTSSYRFTAGQCFASTERQKGSISTCQRTSKPARSKPKSNPPIPANKLPTVGGISYPADYARIQSVESPARLPTRQRLFLCGLLSCTEGFEAR